MERIDIVKKPEINYGSEFHSDIGLLFKKYSFSNKNVFLLTDYNNFKNTEYYSILKNLLNEAGAIIGPETQVASNPSWALIKGIRDIKFDTDIIVCLGGGSVIDFGKALKLYFYKNAQIFVIYTLPGSASIVTPFAIFDNDEFKIGEYSDEILPDYVYINSIIFSEAPIDLIRMGIFDISAHIIESFISKASTYDSRGSALEGLASLTSYARSGLTDIFSLVQADIFAGLSERVGLVLFPHAAGHFLTYKYKVPHSLASMYFLERFVKLVQLRGLVIREEILKQINILQEIFLKDYRKPLSLTDKDIQQSYGMIEKYMPFIFINNPIQLSKCDYLSLYSTYENR